MLAAISIKWPKIKSLCAIPYRNSQGNKAKNLLGYVVLISVAGLGSLFLFTQ
jgi:hypothetical protein